MWDCTPCRPYSLTINFLAVKMMKDSHVFITCSYIPKISLKFVYTYILAGNQHTIITWIPFWFHLSVWWKKSLLSYQLSMHKVFNAFNVKKSVRILHHIKITVSFYVIKGCTIHSNHLWYYFIIKCMYNEAIVCGIVCWVHVLFWAAPSGLTCPDNTRPRWVSWIWRGPRLWD